jgi:hypothetical protein
MHDPIFTRLFRRAEEIREELGLQGVIPFVASQYEEVLEIIESVATDEPQVFIEWGSAVGTVTVMADLLGFEAYGIEIEPDWVEAARRLADEFNSGAEFLEGSFVPRSFDGFDDSDSLLLGLPDAYDAHVIDISDADVIYAFPWPDDSETHLAIFERYAHPGAIYVRFDVDRFTIKRKHTDEDEDLLLPDGFAL